MTADMSTSILDAIGNTPLVTITKLNPNPNVQILAKLEYMNPGGSVKDRPAAFMIEAGENTGDLTPEKTIIEATSGNTGIGLALVCAVKNYKLLLTMSESASIERRKILKARGADILLTPGHLGTDGAIEEVYRMGRDDPDKYFMVDQFNNPANWQAHYYGTAEEIWLQTRKQVDTVVVAMGTSGTVMGISRRLKELNPGIRIVGVEPYLGHKLQGLKNMKEAYTPEIYQKKRLDAKINIEDEAAFEMTRRLAREEGLFVGMSSGAAMAIACQEAAAMSSGIIVVLFSDSGERYLSTPLFTVQETAEVRLFNTLSRSRETFQPQRPGRVGIYSCGPTAHARPDLGEYRRHISTDILCRYFTYRGYEVTHIMNITDQDDKTIAGSEARGCSLSEFTRAQMTTFHDDLRLLGVKPANKYPLTSDHLDEMVGVTKKLVDQGYAYEKLRSVYFDISKFADYGRLSGIDLNKIRLGHTVDLDEYEKDNPRDFTLLKRCRLAELKRGIYIKTEWGSVRPSWHLQCAVAAIHNTGNSFDIHASGHELIFPHNENVIAIAKGLTGKMPARYWLHAGQVNTSESLETLLKAGYTGREIRYWLMAAHYRKSITFSQESLFNARQSLKRIDRCVHGLLNISSGKAFPEIEQLLYDIKNGFNQVMDDDLNLSAALASIFKNIKTINILMSEKRLDANDVQKILSVFQSLDQVLNIFIFEPPCTGDQILQLQAARQAARQSKNWTLADQLRGQLIDLGVEVRDH